MSFTPFTSAPTAPALPGRCSRSAADALAPDPADGDVGATSGRPACSVSSLIWLVPEALLAEIEPEARPLVQRAFTERLRIAQTERAQPPERRRCAPPPFLFQHLARPRFQPGEPRQADQAGLHRLLRLTLWLAADALEAGVLFSAGSVYQPLLAEQCAQLGRVYREIKRRAGAALALVILQGELRFLRHRGSGAVEQMLFA